MLNQWHKREIFEALSSSGWKDLSVDADDCYFVGEAYELQRGAKRLSLSFVADVGIGFEGPEDVEEVVATLDSGKRYELWLHRTRNSKWKTELSQWVDRINQNDA